MRKPLILLALAAPAAWLLAAGAPESLPAEPPAVTAEATFAGGCFWSIEKLFDNLDGVVSATSGFMGGQVQNPSYNQVVSGRTGHKESVHVVYDPAKVTYEQLLTAFWHDIDPTSANGQFCDFGPQYRTAIFYHSEAQRAAAVASKRRLDQSGILKGPVVTEILAAGEFYPAEAYHQDFAKKNPVRYNGYLVGCRREAKLREVWGDQAHRTR